MNTPNVKRRADYQQPDFLISHVELEVTLVEDATVVICSTKVKKNKVKDKQEFIAHNIKIQYLLMDSKIPTATKVSVEGPLGSVHCFRQEGPTKVRHGAISSS